MSKTFDETSPYVQTHLGIMQNVIQRMASNSASCKSWCITIISAMLLIFIDKDKWSFIWITFFPSFLFFILDTYYLALEKGLRNSYDLFVNKIHNEQLSTTDLFSVKPIGNQFVLIRESLKSFSIWGFYLPLVTLILMAKCFLINT